MTTQSLGETPPEKLQPGDVVQLKSGGLKMTVEAILDHPLVDGLASDKPLVQCAWFHAGQVMSYRFAPEALEKAGPD